MLRRHTTIVADLGGAGGGERLNVALVMLVVGDLSGSGGAERHFSDLHQHLRASSPGRFVLITAAASLARLRAAGRATRTDGIVALPLGSKPGRGYVNTLWATVCLMWATIGRRYDVVHICLPTPTHLPYAALMTRLPKAFRPRIALNVIDCTLAHHLQSPTPPDDVDERQVLDAHRLYFKWARLDGVYSWYEAFVRSAASLGLLPSALVAAARYCFIDTSRFTATAKDNTIVFAGRFSTQKRPLMFVDAVANLQRRYPGLVNQWRFEIYGSGPLETALRDRLRQLGLEDRVILARQPDMAAVFGRSKLFVSTQAFENFTSLAMLEAISAGNAVIAENVGQTAEFVKDGENGLLVNDADADRFADAIAAYVMHPEWHERMAAASRRLASEVHTVEHFTDDLVGFWRRVIEQ